MQDDKRTKEELIRELHELRGQISRLTDDRKERNGTSAELNISADKFCQLLERSFGAVLIHADYHIVFINEIAASSLGAKAPEELVGKHVLSIVHPDYREAVKGRIQHMYETCSIVPLIEEKLVLLDGQSIDAEVAAIGYTYHGKPSVLTVFRDITQRKRTDEALRESEEKFRHIFEQAPIGAAIVSLDFRFLRVNPEFCRITGYSEEELLARCFIDITHPDDRDDSMEKTKSLQNGQIDHFLKKKRYVRKDGSICYARTSVSLVKDSEGRPLHFLPLIEDITRRIQFEKALKDSELKFRSLVENVNDWVWEIDENCVYTYSNPKVHDLLGYMPEEVIGKTPFDFMSPAEAKKIREIFLPILSRREQFRLLDNTLTKKDGGRIIVQTSGTTMFNDLGNFIGYRGVDRDITKRKIAENALKESQRFLSTLLSNLPGMAYRCRNDRDWTMEYLSEGCFDLTGYEPSDLVESDKLSYNQLIHPDDREYVWYCIQDAIRGSQPYKIVYRINTAAGKEKWVWEEGRSVSLPNGAVMLEGFVTDITERKHAEQALNEAKAQAELYLDLMCHDINNMNQIGLGFLELALDTLDLDENGRSLISKPLGAFESSSRLIDNVRKLQKIRSGELRSNAMDIGQVLTDVQYHYSNMHGRSVTINYTPVPGYAVMANELLYDVFSNLVGNAIKHSSGHPVINIELEKTTENGTAYNIVRIEDNGPGIPDDLKRLIFYRHLRGSRKAKGSGIGLYLVKTLVDEYHGKVWVEDRIAGDRSKGSRFVVKLPAAEK